MAPRCWCPREEEIEILADLDNLAVLAVLENLADLAVLENLEILEILENLEILESLENLELLENPEKSLRPSREDYSQARAEAFFSPLSSA